MSKFFRFSIYTIVIVCLFANTFVISKAQALIKTSTTKITFSDTASSSVSSTISTGATSEKPILVNLTGKVKQFVVEPTLSIGARPGPSAQSKFILEGINNERTGLVYDQRLIPLTNQQVSLTGTLLSSGEVAVTNVSLNGAPQPPRVSSAPPATLGSRKVLVLLTNFMNDLSEPTNAAGVRNTFYYAPDSANNFFKEASQYRFQLTGIQAPDIDVSPWAMLPMTNENCDTRMLEQWTTARDNLARQQGFEPSAYQSVVYMFPSIINCSYGGLGSIGVLGSTSGTERVYFQPANQFPQAVAHELGHNLGLQHASGYRCSSSNVPADCITSEYGDIADVMGSDYYLPNNYHRAQLGWMSGKISTEVTSSGDYTLVPPTSFLPYSSLIKIPLKNVSGNLTGTSIWLETRKTGAFDNFTSSLVSAYKNGVAIRYGSDDLANQFSRPKLVDTTPATSSFNDAPLLEGQSFTDSAAGVTITVTRANTAAGGARVRVILTR